MWKRNPWAAYIGLSGLELINVRGFSSSAFMLLDLLLFTNQQPFSWFTWCHYQLISLHANVKIFSSFRIYVNIFQLDLIHCFFFKAELVTAFPDKLMTMLKNAPSPNYYRKWQKCPGSDTLSGSTPKVNRVNSGPRPSFHPRFMEFSFV